MEWLPEAMIANASKPRQVPNIWRKEAAKKGRNGERNDKC
jgi:hypothetical protein